MWRVSSSMPDGAGSKVRLEVVLITSVTLSDGRGPGERAPSRLIGATVGLVAVATGARTERSFCVHGTVSATGAGGILPGDFRRGVSDGAGLGRGEVSACGQRERGGQVQRLSLGVAEGEVLTVLVEQFQRLLAQGLIV